MTLAILTSKRFTLILLLSISVFSTQVHASRALRKQVRQEAVRQAGNANFENSMQKRDAFERGIILPSYRKNVKALYYRYSMPGLAIGLETGPYRLGGHQALPKKFRLAYNPAYYSPFSLIRRTLGKQDLTLNEHDIRFIVQIGYMGKDGEMLKLALKRPSDKDDNGPVMLISRDNGEILFFPRDHKNLLVNLGPRIVSETQQFFNADERTGVWTANE